MLLTLVSTSSFTAVSYRIPDVFCLSFECDLVAERDHFVKFARSHIPIKNDGVAAALEEHQVLLLRNLQIEMVDTIVVRTTTLYV